MTDIPIILSPTFFVKSLKREFCPFGLTLNSKERRNYMAEALLKGGNFHRDKIFARQLFLGCMANW